TEVTAAVEPGASGTSLALSRRGPSPGREPLTLTFALPHAAAVKLAIYDVSGRRVRELVSGPESAGTHDGLWGLKDDRGERLPPGVPFARLEVDGQALSEKLVTLE